MIHISGQEHVAFPPEAVFDAGIRAETWPHVDGLLLQPKESILALGGIMRLGVGLRTFHIGLEAEVTEFEHSKRILIEGHSSLAATRIAFNLERNVSGMGTDVHYAVSLRPRSMTARVAEGSIKQLILASVPRFTSEYTANVTNLIHLQRQAV